MFPNIEFDYEPERAVACEPERAVAYEPERAVAYEPERAVACEPERAVACEPERAVAYAHFGSLLTRPSHRCPLWPCHPTELLD